MRIMSQTVREQLEATRFKWRLIRFGEIISVIATLFCLTWFSIELAAFTGKLTSITTFELVLVLFISAVVVVSLFAFLVAMMLAPRPEGIARAIDTSYPQMLDRLSTLTFLERNWKAHSIFQPRIEAQAEQVIRREQAKVLLGSSRLQTLALIFTIALVGAVSFQIYYRPFANLKTDEAPPAPSKSGKPESTFDLKPQDITTKEDAAKAWGEVKIVEPGRDVKLTKVDVLPLQIEMATSGPILSPEWVYSVNGGVEVENKLDAPKEPSYGVYAPLIYLDELGVSDWDVVSYYASARNDPAKIYSSKIYFIQIRPFRRDLFKSDGSAKDGQAMKTGMELMEQISGLIEEQTKIIQETQVYITTTYPKPEMQQQDAKGLTNAESALEESTDHLFAKLVSEGENTDLGTVLDHLVLAEKEMTFATQALADQVGADGKRHELGALAELVATRKKLKKMIDNRKDNGFKGNPGEGSASGDDDDPSPTAEDSAHKLSQVSEVHDREKAALDQLHKLVTDQRALADSASNSASKSKEENRINDGLKKLIEKDPNMFRGSEAEVSNAQSKINEALDTLADGDANTELTHAADAMGDLEKIAAKNQKQQELAQAYQLKKILDHNINSLDKESAQPGTLSDDQLKNLADSSERTTDALKDYTGNSPMGSRPPLKAALSNEKQQALHQDMQNMAQSTPGDGRTKAVQQGSSDLKEISQAFDASQPGTIRASQSGKPMESKPGDELDDARQELMSLEQKDHARTPEDEKKAQADILHDVQAYLDNSKPDPTDSAKMVLMDDVKDLQKTDKPLPMDPESVKKLLDEIEAVRIEANDQNRNTTPREITDVDPSKFPATYRTRIQHYYEELSKNPNEQ